MATISKIHASKQPRRPHHIADWAEKRGLSQADLARDVGADKGLVSRWFNGSTPGRDWQAKLAALFGVEPEALFRPPDDNWLRRLFENHQRLLAVLQERTPEELDRIENMIEAAFPLKRSNGD